jgi:hypothetical protein
LGACARPYIVATDVDKNYKSADRFPDALIALDDVAKQHAEAANTVYLIFDASRSDPALKAKPNTAPKSTVELFTKMPRVRMVVFSSNPGRDPRDADPLDKTHSPFTRAFAPSVDLDWPDLDAILVRVRDLVARATSGETVIDWYRAPAEPQTSTEGASRD